MKALRIFVTMLVMLACVGMATPARAEVTPNFIKDFLSRYRPAKLALPASPAAVPPQALAVARGRQANKENWARRVHEAKTAAKKQRT